MRALAVAETPIRHQCATCITSIPINRRLCHFCTRTVELAAQGALKECLRCRRFLPLLDFAAAGRYRLCDGCRWEAPMTDAERRKSHGMSPSYESRRRRREYRRKAA